MYPMKCKYCSHLFKKKKTPPTSFFSYTVKEKVVINMLIAFKIPTAPWAKLKT